MVANACGFVLYEDVRDSHGLLMQSKHLYAGECIIIGNGPLDSSTVYRHRPATATGFAVPFHGPAQPAGAPSPS